MASRQVGGRMPCACVVACIAALAAPSARADLVIDNFSAADVSWPVAQNVIGSTSVGESCQTGVIGGERGTTVAATSLIASGLDSIVVLVSPARGVIDFSSTVGADGAMSLFYSGVTGDLELDLSGESAFALDFELFDHANGVDVPITITLDDGANSAAGTVELIDPGPQAVQLSFSDFAGIGALDLSSINTIRFDFEAGLATDLRLAEIRTIVPAPGVLAMLTVAGLARTRRRRRPVG